VAAAHLLERAQTGACWQRWRRAQKLPRAGGQTPARRVRARGARGRAQTEFNAPCRTTKYPREVPPLPWFRQALPQMAMAGARACWPAAPLPLRQKALDAPLGGCRARHVPPPGMRRTGMAASRMSQVGARCRRSAGRLAQRAAACARPPSALVCAARRLPAVQRHLHRAALHLQQHLGAQGAPRPSGQRPVATLRAQAATVCGERWVIHTLP